MIARSMFVSGIMLLTACQAQDTKPQNMTAAGSIMVYTSAGALQCDYKGKPVSETAALLSDNGVTVIASSCGSLMMMYPSVCGGATGDINMHEISSAQLSEAQALGFANITELDERGIGYQQTKCQR